jgi:sugar phosphate isomerase/epimerase
MKILFSTGSLSHLTLREVFTIAKEAGFDGCDFVVGKKFNDPEYKETVLQCVQILPIWSMHAPYVHIAAWGDEVEQLRKSLELGKELGARVLNFHPPSWLGREFRFYRWFRRVRDFQAELASGDVRVAIENMPLLKLILPTYTLSKYESIIKFGLARNLYFTYDITHQGTYGGDIVAPFLDYMDTRRLRNVHVSDYSLWREREHLGLGRGELSIVRLLNTMRRVGYDEMVTLEIAPQEFPRTRDWLLQVMAYSSGFLRLHLGEGVQL